MHLYGGFSVSIVLEICAVIGGKLRLRDLYHPLLGDLSYIYCNFYDSFIVLFIPEHLFLCLGSPKVSSQWSPRILDLEGRSSVQILPKKQDKVW